MLHMQMQTQLHMLQLGPCWAEVHMLNNMNAFLPQSTVFYDVALAQVSSFCHVGMDPSLRRALKQ